MADARNSWSGWAIFFAAVFGIACNGAEPGEDASKDPTVARLDKMRQAEARTFSSSVRCPGNWPTEPMTPAGRLLEEQDEIECPHQAAKNHNH